MKLLSLNVWGGKIQKPLLEFLESYSNVDIFCFQEVFSKVQEIDEAKNEESFCLDIYERIIDLLPNHKAIFNPVITGRYGLSTFVHSSIELIDHGIHSIYTNDSWDGKSPAHSRILQWSKLSKNNKEFFVINVHGLWNGHGKTDAPERIGQSENIKSFANSLIIPCILCGDFNLMLDTESVKILSQGMRNLINDFNFNTKLQSISL